MKAGMDGGERLGDGIVGGGKGKASSGEHKIEEEREHIF